MISFILKIYQVLGKLIKLGRGLLRTHNKFYLMRSLQSIYKNTKHSQTPIQKFVQRKCFSRQMMKGVRPEDFIGDFIIGFH